MAALYGQLAGLLVILGVIPYVIGILKGKTRPNRATYAIWAVVNVINVSSYITVGARTTIWTGLGFAFTAILILGLSVKHGMGGFSKFEVACLVLASIAIYLWVATKSAEIALFTSYAAIMLGFLPTIKKAYLLPHTENTISWVMVAIASSLNLTALSSWAPDIAITPVSNAVFDVIVTAFLLFPTVRLAAVSSWRRPTIRLSPRIERQAAPLT